MLILDRHVGIVLDKELGKIHIISVRWLKMQDIIVGVLVCHIVSEIEGRWKSTLPVEDSQ